MSDEKKPESGSFFSSFLGEDASQRAWGLWESVKTNPRLQQAHHQAQEAWNAYDKEKVKQRLAELGTAATNYIDEADRRLETLELGAMNYLQQRGSELVDKVKETAVGPEMEGEVLFSGPERTPISRLDAEIMSLNASPERVLGAGPTARSAIPEPARRQEWLAKSAELDETFKTLVPTKLSEDEFWQRYESLRSELVTHDERRKQLIRAQGKTESEDLDDWGSSDEEEAKDATTTTQAASSDAKESGQSKKSQESADPAESESSRESTKSTKSTEPARSAKSDKREKPEGPGSANDSKEPSEVAQDAGRASKSSKNSEKRIEDEGSDSDWE